MYDKVTKNGWRRNTIVIDSDPELYRFYKRIWKVIDSEHVLTICCGLHLNIEHISTLTETDYRGYWNGNHFVKMTSLRELIKGCKRYNPNLEPHDPRVTIEAEL